jgi:hypothetical protein
MDIIVSEIVEPEALKVVKGDEEVELIVLLGFGQNLYE